MLLSPELTCTSLSEVIFWALYVKCGVNGRFKTLLEVPKVVVAEKDVIPLGLPEPGKSMLLACSCTKSEKSEELRNNLVIN